MTITNYIFDFDGTLMDTQGVILDTIRRTVANLGLPSRTDEQCKSIIGIRTDEAAAALFPELPGLNQRFASEFRRVYEILKADAHEQTFPGVIPTLDDLRQQGFGLAIASSRRRSSLEDYLRGLGIEGWFCAIVGADDVARGKPDPEPVIRVLSATGWDARQTLVTGDAAVDIEMGNAAGCPTCAVTYGNGTLASLEAANPTFVIDSFSSLPRF